MYIVIVPANCTDHLQLLDLSVNKAAKECLRKQFPKWYSDQICQQLRRGIKSAKVAEHYETTGGTVDDWFI